MCVPALFEPKRVVNELRTDAEGNCFQEAGTQDVQQIQEDSARLINNKHSCQSVPPQSDL